MALKEFDAELKSHPRNTASRVERAWAHHLNKDKAKALKDLDQSIRELGNNTGAVSRYMPLFKDIGAPEAALPHLDRLLQKPETRTAELFLSALTYNSPARTMQRRAMISPNPC